MNKLTMLLFLCIVPIILILVIVYSKDKNKESLPLLIRLFKTLKPIFDLLYL